MNETKQKGIEKRSVSGSGELFEKADRRMAEQSITNFSEYVRSLIVRDLERERREQQQAGPVAELAGKTA